MRYKPRFNGYNELKQKSQNVITETLREAIPSY